ncbi:MarR family winged helix-turn-helix transcriptional regulator [Neoactinobaculum massilliense]|uniref:MarR family winged helix-turn-helix transcriptional regulator n=1 Tax=Neoactinobaculum massilliense TaxID=2364794 RepID=UPI000F51B4ED|nr:MarR family transcriptional regulator [Neoactinobaculum massilliense]
MTKEPHWLSQDEQYAWRAYLRGVAQVTEALNRDLLDHFNISLNEYDVLSRLSEAEGRTLRMSELADRMVHSRSRLTHTVRRLEKAGYVSRHTNAEDRRGVDCKLTDTGMDLVEDMAKVHVASVRRVLVDRLGHDQMLELGHLMEQVVVDPEDIR